MKPKNISLYGSSQPVKPVREFDEFDLWNDQINAFYNKVSKQTENQLFTVELGPNTLFDAYIGALPVSEMQPHYCACCRHFLREYGGLVVINGGVTTSVFFDPETAPDLYKSAVKAMKQCVEKSRVVSPYVTDVKTWGVKEEGGYNHFCVIPVKAHVSSDPLLTSFQRMAEFKQNYETLCRGLNEFSVRTLDQVVNILESDDVFRAEKFVGPARWLRELKIKRNSLHLKKHKDNCVWAAVATAPQGWCQPRSNLIGTLLEDIESGKDVQSAIKAFVVKADPTRYRRPTAAVKEQNVARGADIIEKLGCEKSLHRRYAKLSEIPVKARAWTPKPSVVTDTGPDHVFSHLIKPKVEKAVSFNQTQIVTAEKFVRTVLPKALEIDFLVPKEKMSYFALLTAVYPSAPPILQWDLDNNRNRFSWYVYREGAHPAEFGLKSSTSVKVKMITQQPSEWNGSNVYPGKSLFFFLEGCRDQSQASYALFPEILKPVFHPVRNTIEHFSNSKFLPNRSESDACGVRFEQHFKGTGLQYVFRVLTSTGYTFYQIDRWD